MSQGELSHGELAMVSCLTASWSQGVGCGELAVVSWTQ